MSNLQRKTVNLPPRANQALEELQAARGENATDAIAWALKLAAGLLPYVGENGEILVRREPDAKPTKLLIL